MLRWGKINYKNAIKLRLVWLKYKACSYFNDTIKNKEGKKILCLILFIISFNENFY